MGLFYRGPQQQDGEDFKAFCDRRSSYHRLTRVADPNAYLQLECTCPYYLQYAACKHSVAVCVLAGWLQVPASMSIEVLDRVRGRGRPRKVRRGAALEIAP